MGIMNKSQNKNILIKYIWRCFADVVYLSRIEESLIINSFKSHVINDWSLTIDGFATKSHDVTLVRNNVEALAKSAKSFICRYN